METDEARRLRRDKFMEKLSIYLILKTDKKNSGRRDFESKEPIETEKKVEQKYFNFYNLLTISNRISRIIETRIDSNYKISSHESRLEDFKKSENQSLLYNSNQIDNQNAYNNTNLATEDVNARELIKRLNFEDPTIHQPDEKKESVNYGEIYDSLKRRNNYLFMIDVSRILLMIIFSFVIYFEFYLDEIFKDSKLKGALFTFLIIESTFSFICYKIKNKKKVKILFHI